MKMTQKSRRGLIAAVSVAALVPAGVVASAQGSTATAAKLTNKTVSLKSKRFHPATVTITKGSHVTWLWNDPGHHVPHNVTSSKFRSSTTKTSGKFIVTFRKAGTFTYRCTIHPGMNGKVIVH